MSHNEELDNVAGNEERIKRMRISCEILLEEHRNSNNDHLFHYYNGRLTALQEVENLLNRVR